MPETKDMTSRPMTTPPPVENAGELPLSILRPEVKGRFNQYTSGWWALALPGLMARYVARSLFALVGFSEKDHRYAGRVKNFYAAAVGAWMSGLTGMYAWKTYKDIKNIFAETVAWELGKKPEDIGWRDLRRSNNDVVHRTMKNFVKRGILRGGLSFSFFARLIPLKIDALNINTQHSEFDSVDVGTGLTGGYLVMDVVARKETFFEKLQNFIDQKINHTDRVGEVITAADLISLYDRHEKDRNPDYSHIGRMATPEWGKNQLLFGRMADLMNETYGNTPKKETANFTVQKLLFLLGNGMINTSAMDRSLAYIETANCYGMEAVKELAAKANGTEHLYAKERFPLTPAAEAGPATPEPEAKPGFTNALQAKGQGPQVSHTDREAAKAASAGMALQA